MSSINNILLIYTGGTIGMIPSNDSGALQVFSLEVLLESIPELSQISSHIDTVSIEKPIDSADASYLLWNELLDIVKNSYGAYDGFVILHGTDTMAYTASALSFMIEGLQKPVILTGSQLPISDSNTDGRRNVLSAIDYVNKLSEANTLMQEVFICFDGKLMRGNRATKRSALSFDAFDTPNYPLLGANGVVNEKALLQKGNTTAISFTRMGSISQVVLKIHPGMDTDLLFAMTKLSLNVIIIETFGLGNVPTNPVFYDFLRKMIAQECIVINCSQCYQGEVVIGAYATSEKLEKLGVIGAGDMTLEAVLTKANYLYLKKLTLKLFKERFQTPCRGEIS